MLVQPSQDLQAVFDGHLQIQQKEHREGIGAAVSKVSLTGQVLNRLLPIAHGVHRMKGVVLLKSTPHQENVVRIILCQQYRTEIRHSEIRHIYTLYSGRGQGTEARDSVSGRDKGRRTGVGNRRSASARRQSSRFANRNYQPTCIWRQSCLNSCNQTPIASFSTWRRLAEAV